MVMIATRRAPHRAQRDPNLVAGRYRLRRILGRGGHSVIFAADDLEEKRPVAVKMLHDDYASDRLMLRRFFREGAVTANLRHPNTIRVFDFGRSDDGVMYIVMEVLKGKNLREELSMRAKEDRAFTESEAIAIGLSVASSLAEAHAHHLVHRDIKPSNLFLHERGHERVVKVLDFGIAKIDGKPLTHGNYLIGTASFMSPEQVCQQPVDERSDLYSLGLILFSLVTGKLAFSGRSPLDVMLKQVAHPLPEIERWAKTTVSPTFASIVRRATAKLPRDRFPNAEEMRLALLECRTSTVMMDCVRG